MDSRKYLPAIFLLFIGSGCAALVYEIVWFQLLQMVIGSSAVSLGILLGTFMGGMCLGSLLLPRVVSPRRHPMRVYAFLELGIGALGLLILVAVPLVRGVYTAWAGSGSTGIILRAFAAGICLLPPTMLMGATLPAISRWVKATPEGVSWLGFFYGGNIGGGVLGSLLAGFYLLRLYDVLVATLVAVALNVIVALIALALAGRTSYSPEGTQVSPAPGSRTWSVHVAIALSGLTALGSEVIWTRILSLHFGATVYTFALILAVFLVGLVSGSTIDRWSRANRRCGGRSGVSCCSVARWPGPRT
jgi:spermidine synthase